MLSAKTCLVLTWPRFLTFFFKSWSFCDAEARDWREYAENSSSLNWICQDLIIVVEFMIVHVEDALFFGILTEPTKGAENVICLELGARTYEMKLQDVMVAEMGSSHMTRFVKLQALLCKLERSDKFDQLSWEAFQESFETSSSLFSLRDVDHGSDTPEPLICPPGGDILDSASYTCRSRWRFGVGSDLRRNRDRRLSASRVGRHCFTSSIWESDSWSRFWRSSERDSVIARSPSPLRAISVSWRTRPRAQSLGLIGGLLVTLTAGLHELLPLYPAILSPPSVRSKSHKKKAKLSWEGHRGLLRSWWVKVTRWQVDENLGLFGQSLIISKAKLSWESFIFLAWVTLDLGFSQVWYALKIVLLSLLLLAPAVCTENGVFVGFIQWRI